MFEGFSPETGEFLWGLSFHNERPWFQAHREQYERSLHRPFHALAQDCWRLMSERFPERQFGLHVSRIYRDARRLFGRGPYKDHLWFTIYASDGDEGPCFWFELNAARYLYGLGVWSTRPAMMEHFRRAIDANPARFERLARQAERLPGVHIRGEEYKRPKGDRGEYLNRWYNRKYVTAEFSGDFGEELFSPALPQRLCDTFARLMPLHDFIMEAYENSREEGKA